MVSQPKRIVRVWMIKDASLMIVWIQQQFEMKDKEWKKYNKFSYNWNRQGKYKGSKFGKLNLQVRLPSLKSPPQLCHHNQLKHENINQKCVLII